jgi:hypothetical protein
MKKVMGRPKLYHEPLKRQYLRIPTRLYKVLFEKQKDTGISLNRQIVDILDLHLFKNKKKK